MSAAVGPDGFEGGGHNTQGQRATQRKDSTKTNRLSGQLVFTLTSFSIKKHRVDCSVATSSEHTFLALCHGIVLATRKFVKVSHSHVPGVSATVGAIVSATVGPGVSVHGVNEPRGRRFPTQGRTTDIKQ